MNEFLKTKEQIFEATKWLQDNGLQESGLSCKHWEAVQVLQLIKDGDLLDMGSVGGIVLNNAVKLNLKGRKVGIDLAYPMDSYILENDVELFKGDLMQTKFDDNSFDTISCLSVIEHEVNFEKFAKEVSRLLKSGGNAFVSFDFWNPKPEYEKRKLYNLDWNILDRTDVLTLVAAFFFNGMELTSEIDWATQDAVIDEKFCSPVIGIAYTFGILNFIKK